MPYDWNSITKIENIATVKTAYGNTIYCLLFVIILFIFNCGIFSVDVWLKWNNELIAFIESFEVLIECIYHTYIVLQYTW